MGAGHLERRDITVSRKYEGIFVANTTPFKEDGTLDHEALRSEIDYLVDAGINGFFAAGTYGEGPMMSPDEFADYIETFSTAVRKRVSVIAQVGATTLEQTIVQAKAAAYAGVDSIAAIPPYYYPHDDTALFGFYSDLCEEAELPVFIYNNPYRSGNKISPALFAKLCQIPGIAGMKDSGGSLSDFCLYKMAAADKKDFHLLLGSDDMTLSGFVMGAPGAIAVLAAIFPEMFVKMYEAFKKGDLEAARDLQYEAIKARMVLKRGPYISTYKAVLGMLGRQGGYSKKPVRMPSEEELESIRKSLRALGHLK